MQYELMEAYQEHVSVSGSCKVIWVVSTTPNTQTEPHLLAAEGKPNGTNKIFTEYLEGAGINYHTSSEFRSVRRVALTSRGSEKSGRSGTRTPTRAHTTMSTVHTPSTTTGQSAISSA